MGELLGGQAVKREHWWDRGCVQTLQVCARGLLLSACFLAVASGEEAAERGGTRRALVLFGHPGTEVFGQIYRKSAEKLHDGLVDRLGFSDEQVWIRSGVGSESENRPEFAGFRGPATREGIAADVAELSEALSSDDTLWVIVVGHSHFDGRRVFLNLPGKDMDQTEFGKLFQEVQCGQQVFLVTVPASGHFIRDLSAKGRVVISATEADAEVNEAHFHWHFGDVLKAPPGRDEFDRDRDGKITLLDLYLAVVRRVMTDYRNNKFIPTEHALLDDNGDGRGTELQLDDLEPDLGGRAVRRPLSVVIRPPGDGALAASIELPLSNDSTPSSEDPR
jgi:hypothetical protein